MKTSRLGLVLLSMGALGASPGVWAQEAIPAETVPERSGDERRWVVEGYGGLASAAATDLNLVRDHDQRVQQHLFDAQLEALQNNGEIVSWEREQSGERPTIGASWSMGVRVKRRQNESLAFSVGLQFLTAGGSNDVRAQYTREDYYGDVRIEDLTYTPYTLSAKAWAPLVGIHVGRPLGDKSRLEGFLVGGPLFADFEYVSDWSYAFSMRGPSMNGLVFETAGGLDGRGEGTGLAAEVGLRFQYAVGGRLAFFAEGSYAYQRVTSPSGPGGQVRGGERVEWEGEWAIAEDSITAPWGRLDLERPTNDWPEGSTDGRRGDFALDLSGFRLTLGVSFGI